MADQRSESPRAESTWRRPGRAGSFAIVVTAYLVATAVGAGVIAVMDAHPLTEVFIADLAATLVIFVSSVLVDNSSMYDAYWSVAPPLIAIALFVEASPESAGFRQGLVVIAVSVWAVRLTANWARGWSGLDHEDWRYVKARESGQPYWPQSFLGFHLFPTLIVFLCLIALEPARTSSDGANLVDFVAFGLCIGGAVLEFVADEQLRRFNRTKAPGDLCDVGLWKRCRHPNYLGEMAFWWGLWLFAIAADSSWWWTVAGPLAITAMFLFASIPLIDNRGRERRDGYEAYMERTPMLLPVGPKH